MPDHTCRPEDSVCMYSCLSSDTKIEDLVRITFYVTLIIENIFWVSLSNAKLNGSTHVLLGEGRGKNMDWFLLKKGNFIMINEFR